MDDNNNNSDDFPTNKKHLLLKHGKIGLTWETFQTDYLKLVDVLEKLRPDEKDNLNYYDRLMVKLQQKIEFQRRLKSHISNPKEFMVETETALLKLHQYNKKIEKKHKKLTKLLEYNSQHYQSEASEIIQSFSKKIVDNNSRSNEPKKKAQGNEQLFTPPESKEDKN